MKIRDRKMRLLSDDPHCWWCGKEVVDCIPGEGEVMPDNGATIDHLFSRTNRRPRPAQGKWLLSCHECNQDRGRYTEFLKSMEVS